MDVSNLMQTTLQSLNLPVAPDVYNGTATEYIVWYYLDERPILNANNKPMIDATYIRVNYYTKGNPETTKKEIRRLLRAGGFTVYSTTQLYESDTKYRHIAIDAWISGEITD